MVIKHLFTYSIWHYPPSIFLVCIAIARLFVPLIVSVTTRAQLYFETTNGKATGANKHK